MNIESIEIPENFEFVCLINGERIQIADIARIETYSDGDVFCDTSSSEILAADNISKDHRVFRKGDPEFVEILSKLYIDQVMK